MLRHTYIACLVFYARISYVCGCGDIYSKDRCDNGIVFIFYCLLSTTTPTTTAILYTF